MCSEQYEEQELKKLKAELERIARETGWRFDEAVAFALALCEAMIREENVHAY